MTKEDLLKVLDAIHIYVALHSVEYGDVSDYFIVSLEIEKINSNGIVVKSNEYHINFVSFDGYKEYLALHKEDLK